MSTFSPRTVAFRVSRAAEREARHAGHPRVDVEHLLLALITDGGVAGQVLRDAGVRLDVARAAVAAVHAEQLASIGVQAPPVAPAPVGASDAALALTPRAARCLTRGLYDEGGCGDERIVLRSLLDEPSGLVLAVLRHLGVHPDAVRDAEPAWPAHAESPELPGWGRTYTREAVVTVPSAQVWDLVATPSRRMEWLHQTYDGATVLGDDSTVVMTREPGRRCRGRAYRLVSREPGQRVEWDVTSVARPQAPGYRKAVELEAQEDGVTLVRLRVRATRPNLRLRLVPGGARTAFTLMLRLELEGITGRLEAGTAAVDGT